MENPRDFDNTVHKLPLGQFKVTRKDAILTIDPGLSQTFGWAICKNGKLLERGLLNMTIFELPSVADFLFQKCRKYQIKQVVIEKFSHFSGSKKQESQHGTHAKGSTVAKMTRQTSYLDGFFTAKKLDVKLTPPSSWKRRLKGGKSVELAEKLQIFCQSMYEKTLRKKDVHWYDAVGLYLATIEFRFDLENEK